MKNRAWIFILLFIIGAGASLFFVITQTNLLYKNSDFKLRVMFESELDGDSGYITLIRNEQTPSVLDWASFENGEDYVFFSKKYVDERVYFDLPSEIETGIYYLDVEIKQLSGAIGIITLQFKIL